MALRGRDDRTKAQKVPFFAIRFLALQLFSPFSLFLAFKGCLFLPFHRVNEILLCKMCFCAICKCLIPNYLKNIKQNKQKTSRRMKFNLVNLTSRKGPRKIKSKTKTKMNSPIKLTNDDGCLALNGVELLYRYPGGDIDVISYPRPNKGHLRAALFDAREMGYLPSSVDSVTLPSGKVFSF